MATILSKRPDYLQAIGLIDAEWNALESTMLMIFAKMLGAGPQAAEAVFYAVESGRARHELVAAIARLALGDGSQKFIELGHILEAVRKIRLARNGVAHATWGIKDNGDVMIVSMNGTGKGPNRFSRKVPLAELQTIAKRMTELQNAAVVFSQSVPELPGSLMAMVREMQRTSPDKPLPIPPGWVDFVSEGRRPKPNETPKSPPQSSQE